MRGGKEAKRVERKYLPEFVYGSMDGVITTFAVISGVVGASLSSSIILILGFANLIADGFSMSVSDYFSVKSKNEMSRKSEKNEYKTALVTFLAFIVMGFIPLISFVGAYATSNPFIVENQFRMAFILTGITLLIIGWLKGVVTEKHRLKSSLQTFLFGGIAALLAFLAGRYISMLLS